MQGFKKCSNGHYYNEGLPQCPYCSGNATSGSETKTTIGSGYEPTKVTDSGTSDEKTRVIGDFGGNESPRNNPPQKPVNVPTDGRTQLPPEFYETTPTDDVPSERKPNLSPTTRKLVGWLVTYSFDAAGVDYKLYVGKNIIGRDTDCSITVPDPTVSGKHAQLLFRDNQYALRDVDSLGGTFVNDESIGFEVYVLNDGDVIRMGKTTFKFRTSL